MIDEILSIIEEAKKKNYSEFILRYDLQKLLREHDRKIASDYANDYNDGYESGYEEAKEEYYDDAFDDGKQEGIYEARKQFIETLADKIINLKNKLKCNNLTLKEIQTELTELVISLDEDDVISSTSFDLKL